ncbi:F-box protein At3g07870-like [Papaver somniferum]|uniref:F-box protein At3g07870-like n=1 Tax=Papaver somniferum TaxID=3469 RepID=UPI000E701DEB|nr:F-box protein At3g07870-like [Papaver somniferum]
MYTRSSYPSSERSLKVQVYTLGSGIGWRDKGRAEFFISIKDASVCGNGAIHWMEISERKIVAFDLADEKFIMILLPSSVYRDFSEVTLKLLRGYLSVFDVEEGSCVNIWPLKKKKQCNAYCMGEDEFDNYWSWNKEFSIPWDGSKAKYYMSSYHPFAVTKSSQVLLWFNGVLSCYDAKTSTLTELWDDSSRIYGWRHFPT